MVVASGGAFADGGVGACVAAGGLGGGLLVGQPSEDVFEAVGSQHEGV